MSFKKLNNEDLCQCGRLISRGQTLCEICQKKPLELNSPLIKEAKEFKEEITKILTSENVIHESEWADLCQSFESFLDKIIKGELR